MKKKEKVSCIAVFQISFQPKGSHAEAGGGASLAGPLHVFVYTM